MNSMLAAIKAKRGAGGKVEDVQVETDQDQALGSLVDSLDENQRSKLLEILGQKMNEHEENEPTSEKIMEGEATPNERKLIAQKSEEENQGLSEDESDALGKSMIDRHAEQMADGGARPRNLGERAKMYMAKKLKGKGKI